MIHPSYYEFVYHRKDFEAVILRYKSLHFMSHICQMFSEQIVDILWMCYVDYLCLCGLILA